MNLADALTEATRSLRSAGIPDAALDAALLAEHALGQPRAWLRAHGDMPMDPSFDALVRRRAAGEPLAYILGHAFFLGRRFAVSPAVLIPRPETETFVEEVAARAAAHPPQRIVDVGTGSGIIAISLALRFPEAEVLAVDVSPAALAVARMNAAGVPNVSFLQSDLLDGVEGPIDLVAANLPYLTSAEMRVLPRDLTHEPALALDGGQDGNALVRRLIEEAPRCSMALELHPANIESTLALLPGAEAFADLVGVRRFIWCEA